MKCGISHAQTYDAVNNLACLLPAWVSRAAARQRRGRAGRVQNGVCFHLFTRCENRHFLSHLNIQKRTFYQDRLGTNLGKLREEWRFSQGAARSDGGVPNARAAPHALGGVVPADQIAQARCVPRRAEENRTPMGEKHASQLFQCYRMFVWSLSWNCVDFYS
jgi:hypothetical protein